MGELRLRLKKAFDKEGIEIPWPHTKVYFGNKPAEGARDVIAGLRRKGYKLFFITNGFFMYLT